MVPERTRARLRPPTYSAQARRIVEIRLKSNEVEVESEGMQCLHQDVHSSASVVQSNRTNLPVDIVRARSSPFRLQSYPTSRRGGALLHMEA